MYQHILLPKQFIIYKIWEDNFSLPANLLMPVSSFHLVSRVPSLFHHCNTYVSKAQSLFKKDVESLTLDFLDFTRFFTK